MDNQTKTEEIVIKNAPSESATEDSSKDGIAIGAFVVGLINLCTWFIPLAGYPMTIIGIILGVIGMKSTKYKTLAIVGIAISVLGFIASCINSILGVILFTVKSLNI